MKGEQLMYFESKVWFLVMEMLLFFESLLVNLKPKEQAKQKFLDECPSIWME